MNPNFDPSVGKATQFPHNDPRKGGRKKSLRKDLRNILDQDGKMRIKVKDVVNTEENGDVIIRIPKNEALMLKLVKIAMGKTSNNVRAIQMIMEHLEGKPTQLFEFMEYENVPTVFVDATDHLTEFENQEEE